MAALVNELPTRCAACVGAIKVENSSCAKLKKNIATAMHTQSILLRLETKWCRAVSSTQLGSSFHSVTVATDAATVEAKIRVKSMVVRNIPKSGKTPEDVLQ